jgi:exodeoxyribonuclease-5
MRDPDLRLETIHRQALGNPIIKLSMLVRRHGRVPIGIFGPNAAKLDYSIDQRPKDILHGYDYRTDSQILCGMNKTRVKLNDLVRGINNFDSDDPLQGEKLICLMNNKELGIMNGQTAILEEAAIKTKLLLDLKLRMDGYSGIINALTHRKAFGSVKYDVAVKELYNEKLLTGLTYSHRPKVNIFDFGYAISVHKSQGSEFDRVILIDERNSYQTDDDYARWLYTGITRASKKLVIIDNFY